MTFERMSSVQCWDRLPEIPARTEVAAPTPGHAQPRASRLLSQLPGHTNRGSNPHSRIVLQATRTGTRGDGDNRRRSQEIGGGSKEGQEGGRVSALRTLLIDTPRDQGRALRQRYLLFREQHRGPLKPQQKPRLPDIPFRLNPSAYLDNPISGGGNHHNDFGLLRSSCPGDLATPSRQSKSSEVLVPGRDNGVPVMLLASDYDSGVSVAMESGLALDGTTDQAADSKVSGPSATDDDDAPQVGAGQGGSVGTPRACAEAAGEKSALRKKNSSAWIAKSVSFAERPSRRKTLLPPTRRRSVSEACLRRAAWLPAHAQHKSDGPELDPKRDVREGDEREQTSEKSETYPAGLEASWQRAAADCGFLCKTGQSSHDLDERETILTVRQKSAAVSNLPEVGAVVPWQDNDLMHRRNESSHHSDPQQARAPGRSGRTPSGRTENARAGGRAESPTNFLPAVATCPAQLRLAQSPFRRESSREIRGVEGRKSCVCPAFPPLQQCYCDHTGPSFTEGAQYTEREWLNIVSSQVIDHNDYDRFARRRKGNKPSDAKCRPLA